MFSVPELVEACTLHFNAPEGPRKHWVELEELLDNPSSNYGRVYYIKYWPYPDIFSPYTLGMIVRRPDGSIEVWSGWKKNKYSSMVDINILLKWCPHEDDPDKLREALDRLVLGWRNRI